MVHEAHVEDLGSVDYSSQLYLPGKPDDLEKLENLQRIFTSKTPEVNKMNYWQRLKHLQMLSQERRLEIYRAYITVPKCGLEAISSERRGREILISMPKVPIRLKLSGNK